MKTESEYWSGVVEENRETPGLEAWRACMAAIYGELVETWLPETTAGQCLKTDLFEEAVSRHHPLTSLPRRGVGVDTSLAVLCRARQRLEREGHSCGIVAGDLRELPFRQSSFGGVLSGSSLDHFASEAELQRGLAGLARILEPGGTLILTLDNPQNPVVWLRNRLPFRLLHRLKLVPYYVGKTYSWRQARDELERLGLQVDCIAAVVHVPRAPAIWLAILAGWLDWPAAGSLGRFYLSFERLQHWPTRFFTGYYVAIRARKGEGERIG